jgi:ubiquinol-cytochrome c reductase iron-sulfur subunit
MTPPPPGDGAPKGTSADAAGSIRDRLKAPVPNEEANTGGDPSRSDVSDSSFQQTDSRAALEAKGRSNLQESRQAGVEGVDFVPQPDHGPEALTPHEAKVAERKVASLFLLSVLGVLGFVVAYILGEERYGRSGFSLFTPLLGLFMAIALFGIGAGAVLWAKLLMNDEEAVQERHPFGSPEEERAAAAKALQDGLDDAGIKRRPLLLGSLALGAGALALLPVPLLFGLGRFQNKERVLATTAWRPGMRLYRYNGTAVRQGDLLVGAVESVFPDVELPQLRADSPVLLVRMRPEDLQLDGEAQEWAIDGHVAYSSICTHLGCPVKLYEQQTHHLLCPCHQSTFAADEGAKVIFGPAARPLPQLPIAVDDEGYFVATSDFREPIGPSYWERGT